VEDDIFFELAREDYIKNFFEFFKVVGCENL